MPLLTRNPDATKKINPIRELSKTGGVVRWSTGKSLTTDLSRELI
jgi:hypothetical protein